MQIPVTIFAAPSTSLGVLRDDTEAEINRHNRGKRRDPITGAFLVGLQDGLNKAIDREGVDVAHLHRRIYA